MPKAIMSLIACSEESTAAKVNMIKAENMNKRIMSLKAPLNNALIPPFFPKLIKAHINFHIFYTPRNYYTLILRSLSARCMLITRIFRRFIFQAEGCAY